MSEARACAVCGAPCRPAFRVPAAELAPDLDGRPGEPARSTLERWVMRCRRCGAAAPDLAALDLAALPGKAAEFVQAPEYAAESDKFLRWAMICEGVGDRAEAAEAVLQAAWRAEDAGEDGSALRRRAASMWQGDPLRRLDILRRAGALDEALAFAQSLDPADDETSRIISFETERIRAGDTARHSIASALRPPARSPHVMHGKAKVAGLFARMFRV